MKKITFPLKLRMQGPAVADLHAALQRFLDQRVILRSDDAARQKYSAALEWVQVRLAYDTNTHDLVSIFQEEQGLEASGVVDELTANVMNRWLDELEEAGEGKTLYTVKGTLRFFDGFPAGGIIVSAFDRDLRSEQVLGQSQTNRQGNYQIQYSESQFGRAEQRNADLVVKALAMDGSLLAASPILFNAPLTAEVNLTIPLEAAQLPTLFDRIQYMLKPLLSDLPVEELEEDEKHQDISFLFGETGFKKKDLARFALGHKLSQRERNLPPEFWFALLGSSIYEFPEGKSLAEQLATPLDVLPSLDVAAVRVALIHSFKHKEIADDFRQNVDNWIEMFLQFMPSKS